MTRRISVTGLGYVGLPVATTFARAGLPVVSFDIDARRIAELSKGQDRTREVEPDRLITKSLHFTDKLGDLRSADFHIVTVPTPIDASKQPNLGPLQRASAMIGSILKKGDIVVYESTVYPGAAVVGLSFSARTPASRPTGWRRRAGADARGEDR